MDITNIVFVNGLVKEIQRVPYVVKIFCSIQYKMVLRGGKQHKQQKRRKNASSKRVKRTWRRLRRKTQKKRRRTRRASKRLRGG